MRHYKMHDAKTNFSKVIRAVEAGEEIVIQRGGTPVAKIVPFSATPRRRTFGVLKGKLLIADDFDVVPAAFLEHVE